MKLLAVITLTLSSCAHTTFYRDGRPIARFEGDMKGMTYLQAKDGSISWSGEIMHSVTPVAFT